MGNVTRSSAAGSTAAVKAVAVDIRCLAESHQSGVGEYVQNILRRLPVQTPELEYRCFFNRAKPARLEFPVFPTMTLVAAGYGIAIAPAARLASYLRRGVAVRPLAGAPTIVMAYLLRRDASLSDTQARFARRARLVS